MSVWKDNKTQRATLADLLALVAASGITLTGNVTGNVTGNLYGGTAIFTPSDLVESGSLPPVTFVNLNNATAIIEAITTPTVGQLLIVSQKDAGTEGHTLTTAGTFDGLNNTATFDARYETLVLFGVSSTRWVIISNIGSVGLSAV
jgi:hypothetical protein